MVIILLFMRQQTIQNGCRYSRALTVKKDKEFDGWLVDLVKVNNVLRYF